MQKLSLGPLPPPKCIFLCFSNACYNERPTILFLRILFIEQLNLKHPIYRSPLLTKSSLNLQINFKSISLTFSKDTTSSSISCILFIHLTTKGPTLYHPVDYPIPFQVTLSVSVSRSLLTWQFVFSPGQLDLSDIRLGRNSNFRLMDYSSSSSWVWE